MTWIQISENSDCGHTTKEFLEIVPDPHTASFWEIWRCSFCRGYTRIEIKPED